MNARSSRFMLRLAIYVTCAAILSILINLFANVVLNKSLNSTAYYIIVIGLSVASIILGILQILPKFSAFSRSNDEQETSITSLNDPARVRYVQTFHVSQGNPTLENHFKTQQQDHPVKVTMEINGTPVTIESPDVGKIEDIVKHLAQEIYASNRANTTPSQVAVRERKETYNTGDNPE